MEKYKESGVRIFYHGSMGAFAATYVGHFPWFATYNYLDSAIPNYDESLKKNFQKRIYRFSTPLLFLMFVLIL